MKKIVYLFSMLLLLGNGLFGQDIGVNLIFSPPIQGCNLDSVTSVSVLITNHGATTVNSYSVQFSVDGVLSAPEVINDSIQASTSQLKNLTTTADLGKYDSISFKIWTVLPGDLDNTNDTAYRIVDNDTTPVGGSVLSDTTICTGSNPGILSLAGNVGPVENWEESTNGSSWSTILPSITDTFYNVGTLTNTMHYRVKIRNNCGPAFSSAAVVTVDSATVAGTISGAGNVCVGSSGTLTLTGSQGNVQDWETAQNPLGPWNSASNTTTSFNYFNIQTTDDTLFRTIVKLGVCPEDTTPVVAITLDPLSAGGQARLLSGATDTTLCTGNSPGQAYVQNYTGNVLNWEVSTTGANGTYSSIGFGGQDTVTLPSVTANSHFRARIQSGLCPDSTSSPIQVNVDVLSNGGAVTPVFSQICKGSSQGLSLSGNNGTIQFWEERTSSTNWAQILPVVSGSNFTYSNADSSRFFRVIVKNGTCPATPSDSGHVIVIDSTNGGSISTSDPKTVCANNNSGQLVLSGFNGTIQNWFFSEDGGSIFNPVSPVVSSDTFNFSNIDTTTVFRASVINSPCPATVSDTVIITVLPASVAGTISGTTPVCTGDSTTLNLSGSDGNIVTWRVSTNGGASYSNVPASAGQSSITVAVSTNSQYHAIVQKGSCETDTATDFLVTADPLTVAGSVSGSTTVCGGNNSGTLTLSGETGSNLGWIFSTNGGASWTTTANTTSTFNYSNLTQTTLFRVRIKSGVCEEDTASGATITVIPAAVGGTATVLAPNDSLCAGLDTISLSLNGHTGTVIAWEVSENGGVSYNIVSGATGAVVIFPYTFTTNTQFRALVRNGASCDTVRSSDAFITIGSSSVGGNTAGVDSVCSATNNGFVTLSGNVGSVVRWESSTNSGVTWTPEPNSDSVAFNYSGLTSTTLFRAIVQDVTCPIDISDTVEIFVLPGDIPGAVSYAGGNVCAGSGNFTLNLTGSSGTIIRWEKSTDGVIYNSISNTTTSLVDSNISVNTIYRAVLQSDTTCPEAFSIEDTVFVDPVADAGIVAGNAMHCDTANSGMIVTTAFSGTIVEWQSQINGGGFGTVSGSAGMDTINYSNLTAGTHEYKVIVSSGACPNDTSAIVTISVDTNVVAGTLSGGNSYCTLTNSTLLQLSGYTGNVVTWQQSTNGGASFSNIGGTSGRDTVTFVNVSTPTIYRVIVSSGVCGTDTSNTQTIDVGQSVGGTLNSSDSVCISGHNNLLQLSGFTGSILVWQDSTSGGSWNDLVPGNAGFDTLRVINLIQTTSYRVAVQSGSCDTSYSSVATITVNDTVFAGSLGPNNLFFCDTNNADTLLLSGYFGPIGNWQVAINGGPFTDFVPAKTDSAYIFSNLTDSISVFRVIMAGGVCGSDTSNNDTIRVSASLGGILASSDTVCAGNNMGVIKLSDYSGTILGWDSTDANGNFFPMSHTLDSLVYVNILDTISYRVRVQNAGCPMDTSNVVTIYAVPGTNAGLLTGSRSFCTTTNTDSIILVGRSGNILLWESSINGGATWDTVQNQTTDTLVYTNLTTTTMYRVIIEAAGLCPNDTTNVAIVYIGPSDAGTISGDTLLCAGDNADLILSNYIGNVVTWENSFDTLVWNPVPGSDTDQVSLNVTQTTYFRAIVQSDTCSSDTSAIFRVNVNQPFTGSMQTPITQLCYGIGSDTIFIVPGADSILDWEIRPNSTSTFTSLNNQTLFQTYDTLKITTHYRAFVKNGICPVDTTEITLTVDTNTIAGTLFMDDTVCAGSNSGAIFVDGSNANNFTWQSSSDGIIYGPAAGATNDTFYVYNNLMTTTFYRLVLASGGCPSDTTNSIEIFVKPAAVGGVVSTDTAYCKGPNGGVLKLSGYNGNIVNWQQSIGGSGFTNLNPPIVVDSLVYTNIDTTTSYRVILSLGDCPDDTSTMVSVTILPTPTTSVSADGPTQFCEPGLVNLTATGGPGYSWSTGDSTASISVNVTGNYMVVVTDTNSGCTDTDSMEVIVFPAPNVDAGNNATILEGQSVTLNASGASSYEWSPKSGLSDGFISNPVANPTDSILYYVTGLDSNGCEGTDSVLIAVIPDGPEGPPEFTNLFTPNGDGHNDTWKIRNLANCNTCRVSIYNRYGMQVLQDDNYQDDWDGEDLPDGSYFYVIETESGKIYKGSITILRGK